MESARSLDSFAEAELLARVARRDADALELFYDRTCGVLMGVAQSIVRDVALAEDVLQDVYLLIWDKAEVFDPALGKPIAWAIALTRNKALDRLRSLKRRESAMKEYEEMPMLTENASKTADASVEMMDAADLVKQAMNKLPEKQRKALELALLKGLPHAEVATAMQQPLGTIKAWIRRGIIEIRAQLKNTLS